ncbi:rho family protein [Pelomyxa schiedti]|nr:rho family protein [Pelomyxa schiedti]
MSGNERVETKKEYQSRLSAACSFMMAWHTRCGGMHRCPVTVLPAHVVRAIVDYLKPPYPCYEPLPPYWVEASPHFYPGPDARFLNLVTYKTSPVRPAVPNASFPLETIISPQDIPAIPLCKEPCRGRPLKIVVVGDFGVGKTALLYRIAFNTLIDEYSPTVFDTLAATVTCDNEFYNISFWDTAGLEDYDRLRPICYYCTDVVFVCYFSLAPQTLENVYMKWIPEIGHHLPGVPIVLVAMKKDAERDPIAVHLSKTAYNPSTFSLHTERNVVVGLEECSAKTGEGITHLLNTAIHAVTTPQNH